MARKTRDERGATAILVALLAIVLFIAGAIAMDMGQIYAKRSALQSNVDMAVLAAAAEIDGSTSCTSEAVAAAEDYLTRLGNEVNGQYTVDLGGTQGDQDGFIRCDGWRVELWAPKAYAEFGMGKVTGMDGVDVPAFAAAEIKSPSASYGLPMYAVSGCDYGAQQITDPPPGGGPPAIPELTPDSTPNNNAILANVTPSEVDADTTAAVISLTGNNFTGTTAVTFTNTSGGHYEVLAATFSSLTNNDISGVVVPSGVFNAGGIWYVRVLKAGRYSGGSNGVETFTVGELLFCDGAISGNFGTLKLARDDVSAGSWLSYNIIRGVQPTLALYPGGGTTCDDGVSPAVTSEHGPNDGTNCLGTDPGFPNEEATDGLVTGSGGALGRLNAPTTGNCSRNGTSSKTMTTSSHPAVTLNDDMLSCFIIDDSPISDAVSGDPGILSADIFASPRFFMIPVIPVEATNGSSNFYPIIDFRPGFITGQSVSATNASPGTVDTYNGVVFHSGHVEQLNVILFDEAALPEFAPAVGGEGDYTGSGTKVIVLVE